MVIVSGDQVSGIVTDRDIVVRGIAEGRDPSECTVGEVATGSWERGMAVSAGAAPFCMKP